MLEDAVAEQEETIGQAEQPSDADEADVYKAFLGLVTYQIDFLSPDREKELWARRHCAQAREEILTAHLPLCKAQAREAFKKNKRSSISEEDFSAQAYEELVISYDKYVPDNEQKARFCTYAAIRIKYALFNFAIDQSSTIKLATTKAQRSLFARWGDWNKIAVSENPKATTYQRQKRIAELMAERTPHKDADVTLVAEYEVRRSSRLSLNLEKTSDDDQHYFEANLINTLKASWGEATETLEEQDKVRQLLLIRRIVGSTKLNDRERFIIEHRHLAEEDEAMNLVELGQYFEISTERVRQIETEALRKLKQAANWRPLTSRKQNLVYDPE